MIAVIDNYDSFVHNLARYVRLLGHKTEVFRNDQIGVAELLDLCPAAVILSPGPCGPREAGICLNLVRQLDPRTGLLGICLGHQVLVEALDGRIEVSDRPMHGQASMLSHQQAYLFRRLPSPFRVGRYHSLRAPLAGLPEELESFGELDDGTVMAVAHRTRPWFGLQFHPESILTEYGAEMLSEFFCLAGVHPDQPPRTIELFSGSATR